MSDVDQGDTAAFVIEQRDRIEIYAGAKGHVIMRQESPMNEESVIFMHPDDVDLVIKHLQVAKAQALATRAEEGFSPQ